jgi:hypothetical protein
MSRHTGLFAYCGSTVAGYFSSLAGIGCLGHKIITPSPPAIRDARKMAILAAA